MWPALADEAIVLGDETWTFADLLLLGIATGLLEEATSSTRDGLAALQLQAGPSQEQLHAEAVAFRRARTLESGQDLRAWLAARELTMEEWQAHLQRSLAARELTSSSAGAAPGTSESESEALTVDLACLAGLGEPWCIDRLRLLGTRQRALEEAARRCAAAKVVDARVGAHANDWTEFVYDELLLPSREAANEALLCARDDGIEAADLAARAGLVLVRHSDRHDSLPVAAATLLDGALPDQPFGPVALDRRWAVLWLRERRRPSLEDETLRATAAAELLEEALERIGQGQIRAANVL